MKFIFTVGMSIFVKVSMDCWLLLIMNSSYHHTQATLVGCWAHARRKFHEAKIAQGKKPIGKADMALSTIQKLYRIETQIKSLPVAQRLSVRQEKSLPILATFKQWLYTSEQQVLPKTKLGEAILYTLNQWDKLVTYTDDGHRNSKNQWHNTV